MSAAPVTIETLVTAERFDRQITLVRDLLLDHELIAEDLELGDRLEAALRPDIWIGRAAA